MGGGTGGGGVWPPWEPCCGGVPGKALGGACGVGGNACGVNGGVACWPGPNGFDGMGMSSASSAGVLPGVGSLKPVFVTGGCIG
jgi:hypothetical protein